MRDTLGAKRETASRLLEMKQTSLDGTTQATTCVLAAARTRSATASKIRSLTF